MASARKFRELKVAQDAKEPEELKTVDLIPRELQSDEMRPAVVASIAHDPLG